MVLICNDGQYYYTRLNEVEGGYTGFTLSSRLSICLSVDKIVSALYLLQYLLDSFHIYTSYQATSEGVSRVSFGKLFKFVTLNLSCFDWSIVCVIMGRRGVSSERRRSSCSSLFCIIYWPLWFTIAWLAPQQPMLHNAITTQRIMYNLER